MLYTFLSAILFSSLSVLWHAKVFSAHSRAWYLGKNHKDGEKLDKFMVPAFFGTFLASFLMAHVLRQMALFFGITDILNSVVLSFWLWLGFVLPTGIFSSLYSRRHPGISLLDALFVLVGMILMAMIISVGI